MVKEIESAQGGQLVTQPRAAEARLRRICYQDCHQNWEIRIVLTHSGHGDHEEIDTVPVAQTLTVGEVGRVSRIFKLKIISIFKSRLKP